MSDVPLTGEKSSTQDGRQMRRVRLFSLIQFIVSAGMSLLLMVGRIMMPAEAVTVLGAVWLLVVLPSFLCATGLMAYCAKTAGREVSSWSGELAFWSVVPVGAFIMLWVF